MKDGTQELPDSARRALLRVADELRDRFSGTIEIECHEGGVRKVRESRVWRPEKADT